MSYNEVKQATKDSKMVTTEFTPMAWATTEDKEEFVARFQRFVKSDFAESRFSGPLYNRLNMCFGHIAHYNRAGFYGTWFNSDEAKLDFLRHILEYPCSGDPAYTFCDVEKHLQEWVRSEGLEQTYRKRVEENIERQERAMLAVLQAKYGK